VPDRDSSQLGGFEAALPFIHAAIKTMLEGTPSPYTTLKDELFFACLYAQACCGLVEMKRLHSSNLWHQMALVASKLSLDLPLQPEHRVPLIRTGIKSNFYLGNFMTAANLIKVEDKIFRLMIYSWWHR
jgi:hypothetical protein